MAVKENSPSLPPSQSQNERKALGIGHIGGCIGRHLLEGALLQAVKKKTRKTSKTINEIIVQFEKKTTTTPPRCFSILD